MIWRAPKKHGGPPVAIATPAAISLNYDFYKKGKFKDNALRDAEPIINKDISLNDLHK